MRSRFRTGFATAALVALVAAAWLWLAPTQIGGSTSWVITHGTSMAPRFHPDDLALVRAAEQYGVGDIVAYRDPLLHVIVLHRIIARDGARYVLRGDNNKYVDPTHPVSSQLIGRLWLHVPHGGRVLAWLHTPLVAAVLSGAVAALLLLGGGGRRRRRNHRRSGVSGPGRRGASPMRSSRRDTLNPTTVRTLLMASLAAALAFLVLGLFAVAKPLYGPKAVNVPYLQRVTFGYHARAPTGPVYPAGVVDSGDPVYLRLVHTVRVDVGYSFSTTAPHRLVGREAVSLRLAGPSGWTRAIGLGPPRRFTHDHASASVNLDLPALESLISQVQTQTGVAAGTPYAVAVVAHVHVSGTVAGQPVDARFAPALSFQLDPVQLQLGGGSTSTASGGSQNSFAPSVIGQVARTFAAQQTIKVAGHRFTIASIRWIAFVGFLLAAACALLALLARRRLPTDEAARIQAQYGHLIVPISTTTEDQARRMTDVTSFRALVQLAQSGERLILHRHDERGETYLVEDEGAVYRYISTRSGRPQLPPAPAPEVEEEEPEMEEPEMEEPEMEEPEMEEPVAPAPLPAPAPPAAPVPLASASQVVHPPAPRVARSRAGAREALGFGTFLWLLRRRHRGSRH